MRDRSGGFVLVAALSVLAVLASLVGGVAYLARASAADAGLARDGLTRDALLHAGVELAGYQIFTLRRPLAELVEQRIRLDGGVVTISVTGESGKVDLNGADPKLLAAAWRAAGAGGLSPEEFADRVVDWRDPDEKRGKQGAEREDYARSGAERGPANGPFQTIDELQHVLGMTADRVTALAPLVTVHNPQGKISAMTAPREVLRLVEKVDGGLADAIIGARRHGGEGATEAIRKLLGDRGVSLGVAPGRAFRVTLSIERGGLRTRREAVLTAIKDDVALYRVTEYSGAGD